MGGIEGGGRERVTVLLMATAPRPGLENALGSLRKFGYAFRVLGQGEAWGGWRHRMRAYRDAAASLPPRSLIVCMDAYDAMALRAAADLAAVFRGFGKSLLIGLEQVCGGNGVVLDTWWTGTHGAPWLVSPAVGFANAGGSVMAEARAGKSHTPRLPSVRFASAGLVMGEARADKSHTPRLPSVRFANAGLVMGEAWAVADLYGWMLRDERLRDDQVGLGRYLLAHPDRWAPDVHQAVFRNVLCEPSFLAQKALVHDARTRWQQVAAALGVASATLAGALAADTVPERVPSRDLESVGCFFAHFPGINTGSSHEYNRVAAAVLGPHARFVGGHRLRRLVRAGVAALAAFVGVAAIGLADRGHVVLVLCIALACTLVLPPYPSPPPSPMPPLRSGVRKKGALGPNRSSSSPGRRQDKPAQAE